MIFLKLYILYLIFFITVKGQQQGNFNQAGQQQGNPIPNGQHGSQNPSIPRTQYITQTTTSTRPPRRTRPKPITNEFTVPQLSSRSVQTYTPPNTTTTVLPFDRPALRYNVENKPYEIKRGCKDFRLSSMPTVCCLLPSLITPQSVVDSCNATCFPKKDSKHCCKTNCKMSLLEIFKNDIFNYDALIKAHEASFTGPLKEMFKVWEPILRQSFHYCLKDQDTKDTTTPPPTTTTDRLNQLIQNAIEQGQGQTVAPPPPTTLPTTTRFTGSTHASVPTRRHLLRYCNVPVYIYKIIACMRARNFINCPNFNNQNQECSTKKDMMISCGNELNYNY